MKRILFTLLTCIIYITSYAQEPYKHYCTISAYTAYNSIVMMDFGLLQSEYIADKETGELLVDRYKETNFTHLVRAANFLSKNGWKLESIQLNGTGVRDTNTIIYWVFSKEIVSLDELLDGFEVRRKE